MRLSTKVALITGAAYGLGYATALRFAEEGAVVIVTDPKLFPLTFGHKSIFPMELDVADKANWSTVVNSIFNRFGRIDIFFHNAGTMVHSDRGTGNGSEDRSRTIWIDQIGYCLGLNAILPIMKKNGGGIIFNVLSIYEDEVTGKRQPADNGKKILNNTKLPADHRNYDITSLGFYQSGTLQHPVVVRFSEGRPTEIINACLFIKNGDDGSLGNADLMMDEGFPITD